MLICPSSTFLSPSNLISLKPCFTASSRIIPTDALFVINSLSLSLIMRISCIPILPLYPTCLHLSQPSPRKNVIPSSSGPNPAAFSSAGEGVYSSRQYMQIFLASLCAMIPKTEGARRKGSTPMSTSLVMELGESFVCRVLNTKCPVKAASAAMEAVSGSLISPIITISGSCLRIERNALAKVRFFLMLICTWLIMGSWYSTGSSTVMIFFSTELISLSAEYSVVVFPLPVGPVTSIIP